MKTIAIYQKRKEPNKINELKILIKTKNKQFDIVEHLYVLLKMKESAQF